MPIPQKIIDNIAKHDPNLTYLDLSNLDLESVDLEGLVEVLSSNVHITSLDLSWNNITHEGALSLCSCEFVSRIIINDNQLGDKGAGYLLQHPSLLSLEVNDNGLSDDMILLLRQKQPPFEHFIPSQTKKEAMERYEELTPAQQNVEREYRQTLHVMPGIFFPPPINNQDEPHNRESKCTIL